VVPHTEYEGPSREFQVCAIFTRNKKSLVLILYSSWCWTTQVFQADYYTSELAFYRRGAGLPNRNMGSLYWQLEDLWTAPTWASIEADGRWKVLMYRAKDIYQPVVAHSFYNTSTGDLEVWAISDLWSTVNGTMNLSWMNWDGTAVSGPSGDNSTDPISFTIGPINSTLSYTATLPTTSSGQTTTTDPANLVLKVDISAVGQSPNSDEQHTYIHTSYFHPASLQDAKLQDPGLTLASSGGDGNYKFTVTASTGVAAWVWLDHPLGVQGAFSDNGFWLTRGETKTVQFAVKNDWTEGAWVDGVTVRSIWNNTLSG
jgi:beta-mannosidase